ncbi:MAG: SDR family oxidoreductase [Gemmatimonadetes bacterium]|nr:SDR family oxidoreductase [Gemmatimonadota bacterium]
MSPARSPVSVADRFRGERILLTGATGFLAKSILEKIVRAIPDVAQIYLLVRPHQRTSAAERVKRDVLRSSVFDRLRAMHDGQFCHVIDAKICPIAGDLSQDRLGLSEDVYADLAQQVTCIINSAAVCEFGEQLDRALQVNTLGPRRILQLAKDAGNIPVLHVSTCYVNGVREGEISEDVLPLGHTVATFTAGSPPVFDLDVEIASMLDQCAATRMTVAAGDRDSELFARRNGSTPTAERIAQARPHLANTLVVELGSRLARSHGWTDTYTFSKSLGEQLLIRDRAEVPLAIMRPSIIESTYTEPVPGWIEGLRMGDPLIIAMGKGNLPEFVGRDDNILDLIPCDMVTNAILAAVPPPEASHHCMIYQVASSTRNPLTHRTLNTAVHDALHAHPLFERDGQPIRPKPVRIIPVEKFERKLEWKRRWLILLRAVYARIGLEHRERWVTLRIRAIRRLREFFAHYGFYASHSPRFLSNNAEVLFDTLSAEDKAAFPFDVTCIDWSEYFVQRHVPGLRRMIMSRRDRQREDAPQPELSTR